MIINSFHGAYRIHTYRIEVKQGYGNSFRRYGIWLMPFIASGPRRSSKGK